MQSTYLLLNIYIYINKIDTITYLKIQSTKRKAVLPQPSCHFWIMLLKCKLRNVKLNISFVYISHSNVLEREINKNVLCKLN